MLPNDRGGTFDLAAHRGEIVLVYFGYTHCPDVCPETLNRLDAVWEHLGPDRHRVEEVFVTLDPRRDTPELLRAYLSYFDPAPVGLTGSPEAVAAAARAWGVTWRPVKGGAFIDHTSLVAVSVPTAGSGYATVSRNSATPQRSRATSDTSCMNSKSKNKIRSFTGLRVVLTSGPGLTSDAAGGQVRGTDWPGVPSLSPPRLISPRAGTLRVLAGTSGALVVALAALGLRDPLGSMSSYTAALMALNQIAPPLLLLALPPAIRTSLRGRGKGAALASFLLDPWAATTLFIGLSIAVSLPGVFDPSVMNALYAAPLGVLELLSGLLFWAQFMPATRRIRSAWLAGTVAWIGAMPMTVVAVIWMLSPDVLYTPYLDVICRWNIPPLVDQRWAGFLMFVAGVPVQLAGVWLLLGSFRRRDPAS